MGEYAEADLVYLYQPKTEKKSALAEFSLVTLRTDATTFDGALVPAGSVGTIVTIWDEGAAFDVEFTEPSGLASVGRDDLQPSL